LAPAQGDPRLSVRSRLRQWRAPSCAAASRRSSATRRSQTWTDLQRREFHEALLEAGSFEDLPGKWQAAILAAEQNRPKLRLV
jgi:hypothetical protein